MSVDQFHKWYAKLWSSTTGRSRASGPWESWFTFVESTNGSPISLAQSLAEVHWQPDTASPSVLEEGTDEGSNYTRSSRTSRSSYRVQSPRHASPPHLPFTPPPPPPCPSTLTPCPPFWQDGTTVKGAMLGIAIPPGGHDADASAPVDLEILTTGAAAARVRARDAASSRKKAKAGRGGRSETAEPRLESSAGGLADGTRRRGSTATTTPAPTASRAATDDAIAKWAARRQDPTQTLAAMHELLASLGAPVPASMAPSPPQATDSAMASRASMPDTTVDDADRPRVPLPSRRAATDESLLSMSGDRRDRWRWGSSSSQLAALCLEEDVRIAAAEQELVSLVRRVDVTDYGDALGWTQLPSPELLNLVLRGLFGKSPMRLNYVRGKGWEWDAPSVERIGWYTPARMLAIIFEAHAWAAFYRSTGVDARTTTSRGHPLPADFMDEPPRIALGRLRSYWSDLTERERAIIVGPLEQLWHTALSTRAPFARPKTGMRGGKRSKRGQRRHAMMQSNLVRLAPTGLAVKLPARGRTKSEPLGGDGDESDESDCAPGWHVSDGLVDRCFASDLAGVGLPDDVVRRWIGLRIREAYTQQVGRQANSSSTSKDAAGKRAGKAKGSKLKVSAEASTGKRNTKAASPGNSGRRADSRQATSSEAAATAAAPKSATTTSSSSTTTTTTTTTKAATKTAAATTMTTTKNRAAPSTSKRGVGGGGGVKGGSDASARSDKEAAAKKAPEPAKEAPTKAQKNGRRGGEQGNAAAATKKEKRTDAVEQSAEGTPARGVVVDVSNVQEVVREPTRAAKETDGEPTPTLDAAPVPRSTPGPPGGVDDGSVSSAPPRAAKPKRLNRARSQPESVQHSERGSQHGGDFEAAVAEPARAAGAARASVADNDLDAPPLSSAGRRAVVPPSPTDFPALSASALSSSMDAVPGPTPRRRRMPPLSSVQASPDAVTGTASVSESDTDDDEPGRRSDVQLRRLLRLVAASSTLPLEPAVYVHHARAGGLSPRANAESGGVSWNARRTDERSEVPAATASPVSSATGSPRTTASSSSRSPHLAPRHNPSSSYSAVVAAAAGGPLSRAASDSSSSVHLLARRNSLHGGGATEAAATGDVEPRRMPHPAKYFEIAQRLGLMIAAARPPVPPELAGGGGSVSGGGRSGGGGASTGWAARVGRGAPLHAAAGVPIAMPEARGERASSLGGAAGQPRPPMDGGAVVDAASTTASRNSAVQRRRATDLGLGPLTFRRTVSQDQFVAWSPRHRDAPPSPVKVAPQSVSDSESSAHSRGDGVAAQRRHASNRVRERERAQDAATAGGAVEAKAEAETSATTVASTAAPGTAVAVQGDEDGGTSAGARSGSRSGRSGGSGVVRGSPSTTDRGTRAGRQEGEVPTSWDADVSDDASTDAPRAQVAPLAARPARPHTTVSLPVWAPAYRTCYSTVAPAPFAPTVASPAPVVLTRFNGATALPASPGLSDEIDDFALHMFTLFSKRHSRLLAMIEFVRSVTLALWGPRAIVEVYGSYTTCLSVPSSDLDLVVLLREDDARAEAAANAQVLPHMHGRPLHPSAGPLQRVTAELKRRGGLEWIRAILTTKVPVLKFSTVRERIPTDVSVAIVPSFPSHSLPAHSGIMARELVRDLILVHADLAPVTLVLKQFLVEAGLNDPYRGGLGSYCLVLMVACWLDTSRTEETAGRAGAPWASPMSPQLAARTSGSAAVSAGRRGRSNSNPDRSSSPKSSLAQALLGFLTYMGTTFDPRLTGVRWDLAEGRGHFFPLPPLKPGGLRADGTIPPPLVLLDPFNPASNVGSSVFNWHLVQGAFRSALEALVAPDTEYPNMSLLSRIVYLGA